MFLREYLGSITRRAQAPKARAKARAAAALKQKPGHRPVHLPRRRALHLLLLAAKSKPL